MSYLDDLKNLNPKNKAEKRKEETIIFSEPTSLRCYAPTEFVFNGGKRIKINTKVVSGKFEGMNYPLFFSIWDK